MHGPLQVLLLSGQRTLQRRPLHDEPRRGHRLHLGWLRLGLPALPSCRVSRRPQARGRPGPLLRAGPAGHCRISCHLLGVAGCRENPRRCRPHHRRPCRPCRIVAHRAILDLPDNATPCASVVALRERDRPHACHFCAHHRSCLAGHKSGLHVPLPRRTKQRRRSHHLFAGRPAAFGQDRGPRVHRCHRVRA